LQSHAPH
jgi:hypothetical protein